MNKQFIKDTFGWGVLLWLINYILGMLLFTIISPSVLGWIMMPMGIVITIWVLLKEIKSNSFVHYLYIGIIWTLISIVLDYLLLITVLKPVDMYYAPGVYFYYILTFILPIIVGRIKTLKK